MKLKELRNKTGITQKEMAKVLNVAHTTYNGYELGKISPDVKMLIKLADYFNVSIDELVGRETENLNLKFVDETKKEIIKEILKLDTNLTNQVNAFLQGMKLAEEERELIREYLRSKGKKD